MMQHKDWQEQIPFYVAQTLNPDEIRYFEAHLQSCESCQQEIDDWRSIASAVWREADDVARQLPPLSPEVYNRLNYRDRTPQSKFSSNPPSSQAQAMPENVRALPRNNTNRFPITLVAGLVVAVIFGGLLMMLALRPTENPQEIALDATNISSVTQQFGSGIIATVEITASSTPETGLIPPVNLSEEPSASVTPGAPIFLTNTAIPTNLATVTPVATTTQSRTAVPIPTQTISTMSMLQPEPTIGPPGATATVTSTFDVPAPLGGGPYITVTPGTFAEGLPVCEAYNPGNAPIELYTQADSNSEIVGVILRNQTFTVTATSATGWYSLRRDNNVSGWLQPGFAYLRGNCLASLPIVTVVPLATAIPGTPDTMEIPTTEVIAVIDASFADLYTGPDFNSPGLGIAERNQQFPVIAYQGTGANRWVLVRRPDTSEAWVWASVVIEYPANQAPATATP